MALSESLPLRQLTHKAGSYLLLHRALRLDTGVRSNCAFERFPPLISGMDRNDMSLHVAQSICPNSSVGAPRVADLPKTFFIMEAFCEQFLLEVFCALAGNGIPYRNELSPNNGRTGTLTGMRHDRWLAPLLHASFIARLATTPLLFVITSPQSGCEKDLHRQAVDHARHTQKSGDSTSLPYCLVCGLLIRR